MTRLSRFAVLVTVLVTGLRGSRAAARDDLGLQLTHEFKGQILMLRNFNSGARLVYDASGQLLRGGPPGTWTLDGHIRIREIALRQDGLDVDGLRILAAFDTTKQRMYGLQGQAVRLEIGSPQEEPSLDKLRALIFKVFHPQAEDTDALMPPYWKPVFQGKKWDQVTPEEGGMLDGEPLYAVDKKGDVAAPGIVFTPDPPYSQQARKDRLQGTVKFLMVLDKTGRIRDVLETSAALGEGLDEIAIETVQRWKFKPATKDGVPVSICFAVEITFRLV